MAAKLCEYCSKINFEVLRNPSASDIDDLRQGKIDIDKHFEERPANAYGANQKTSLGFLSRIKRNFQSCGLCSLIWQTLTRYNNYQPLGLTQEGEEVNCYAEPGYYGQFQNPKDETKRYWTRRLSILTEAGDVSIKGSKYFCFQACNIGASLNEVEADVMIFGGRLRPLHVDLQWLQQWLQICVHEHGQACELKQAAGLLKVDLVRFLDVGLKSVVELKELNLSDIKFMALSYVWGSSHTVMLNSNNFKELSKPGALKSLQFPKTIADALYLAEAIGVKYVWIDALCIFQDDTRDKKSQINHMGAIYNAAFVTVVAASGADADAGLPGLRPGSRNLKQQEIMVKEPTNEGLGLSLITTLNPLDAPGDHYLEHTTWNSRGWTMQERVLSRRVLAFTDEQVYWACNESTFCEESHFEVNTPRFSRFHDAALEPTLQRSFRNFYEPQDEQTRFWRLYRTMVARYTQRKFTYDGDVHDGFSAILSSLSKTADISFLWGLPRDRLELGLSWRTFNGQRRRTSESTLPMTLKNRRVRFPSWSWMGWIGEAWISVDDDRYDLKDVPEVICYIHQSTSPLAIVRVASAAEEDVQHQTGFNNYGTNDTLPPWKLSRDLTVSIDDVKHHLPCVYANLADIPDGHLFFWTSLAIFNLTPSSRNRAGNTGPTILDGSGSPVGDMSVMSEDHSSNYNRGQKEFIVIGSRRFDESNPELVVLQIEWRDGIAYRVNVGDIAEKAWIAVERKWNLVALG